MRPALEIFSEYARERRQERIPGYVLDAATDITRHLPSGPDEDAILSFARFDRAGADGRIDAELAAMRRRGCECEWKVRFVCHTYPMRTKPYGTGAVTRS